MEVLGISVIQRLVVPRVLAIAFIAVLLNGVATDGRGAGRLLASTCSSRAGRPAPTCTPSPRSPSCPTSTSVRSRPSSSGSGAGIVACHQGVNAKGGPQGVGNGVNQSVVISFVLLFVVNTILTVVYYQIVPPKGL